MNCCICGTVKNCGPYLKKVLENMEKIGSIFNDYEIIIYYDKSSDNTIDILNNYQQTNSKMYFYVNKNIMSPFRTHNLAIARNFCLNYVRQNREKYPYFIMMDCDDVNFKEVNTDILKKYLYSDRWDGLSFNTSPKYYDIWGLSIEPFCFSYNHFKNNYKYHNIIGDYMDRLLKNAAKNNQLVKCISSFNGFSIYRTNKFLDTYYDGRVRTDLFTKKQINSHSVAQKSNGIIYPNLGHIKCKHEDCEHRSFHRMAGLNSGARIMISPEIIFT